MLKVVNITPAIRLWWLLTCQNSLAEISPLILICWYSWWSWLISMHSTEKTFHFLSALSDIVITLRKSREIIFAGYFWKTLILARDIFEMSQRRHGKDNFFEIFSRRLKGVTQKTSSWNVFETSERRHKKAIFFWDVSKSSLICHSQWRSIWDLWETSYSGWVNFKYCHNLIVIASGVLLFISFSFVQVMLWKI